MENHLILRQKDDGKIVFLETPPKKTKVNTAQYMSATVKKNMLIQYMPHINPYHPIGPNSDGFSILSYPDKQWQTSLQIMVIHKPELRPLKGMSPQIMTMIPSEVTDLIQINIMKIPTSSNPKTSQNHSYIMF